jgi:crotonobetainyl-CoA:carnitine CoA-transferase CaiB-like acyl-CoA transferase
MPAPPHQGPGPLAGLSVLDFSRVLAGPHCARMLADLGADVIKIEPPEGDATRFTYPRINSIATYFTQQNCGKRNLSLDLKQPEARELLQRLADKADVLIENFRAGVMGRLGLDHETLLARNPRLVYCSITGYGHTGPWSGRRAYAPVVGAEVGLTWLQGEARRGSYANDPVSHADVYTGLEALGGILAALFQRERTGRGQWLELSMAETLLSINEHAQWHLRTSDDDGADDLPSYCPEDFPVLPTKEGHHVVLAGHPAAKGTFQLYCRAVQRPDLLEDPRLATVALRRQNLDVIIDALAEFSSKFDDLDALEAAFAEHQLAMGVLRTVREIGLSDWAESRGAVVEVSDRGDGVVRVTNSPWHFSDADSGVRSAPAYRGEHNREVLRELLGLDDAAIDRLEAEGVLTSRVPEDARDASPT